MESRPWYKKVTQYFRRKDQVTPAIHEFPLSEPKPKVVKVRRRKRLVNYTSGASSAWVAFWLWVIIAAVVAIAVIKYQYP